MKRVGLYVRVSTGEQNVDMQLEELRDFSKARGWQVVKEYSDEGYSGTTAQRPMLTQLMADARSRKIDVIVCWKLDRLFRSLKHLVLTLNEFTELGVEFVAIRDQIDLSTAAGRMMAGILGSLAEFEASLIRERVKAGLALAKRRGKRLGRPVIIDGPKVRELRKNGWSLNQIARELSTPKRPVTKSGVSNPSKSNSANYAKLLNAPGSTRWVEKTDD